MRRKNHHLVFTEALDQAAHFVFLIRVQTIGRLVEDQHVRVMDQRLREAGAVFVAFRQRVDRLIQHAFEETQLDRTMHRALAGVALQAAQFGAEIEKAVDGHVGITRRVFRQVADQPLGGNRVFNHVVAANQNAARSRGIVAGDHAHRGRLAGAVGAEKAQHFAAFDAERHIIHRQFWPESLDQVFDVNQ